MNKKRALGNRNRMLFINFGYYYLLLVMFIELQEGIKAALISGKPIDTQLIGESSVSRNLNDSLVSSDQSILTALQQIKLKEIRKLARLAGHENPEQITVVDPGLCYKNDCLEAAKEFYTSMDFSKEPCTEWRKFACEWRTLSANSALNQLATLNLKVEDQIHDILQDYQIETNEILAAQEYFKACLAWFQGWNKVDHISRHLQTLGNWPILRGLDFEGSWMTILVEIIKFAPENVTPFLLKLDAAAVNGKQVVLQIDVGVTYLEIENEDIQQIIRTLRGRTPLSKEDHFEEDLLEMEKCMQILSSGKYKESFESSPSLITLKTLNEKLKTEVPDANIDIFQLVQSVFVGTDFKISADTELLVNSQQLMSYLKQLNSINKRALVNVLFLQLAIILLGDTTNVLEESGFLYFDSYKRPVSRVPSHQCLTETSEIFSYALSEEYARRYFKVEDETLITNITQYLKGGFKKTIDLVKWLQPSSKEVIKERINSVEPLIGFPKWIMDPAQLTAYYTNLKLPEKRDLSDEALYLRFRNAALSWQNGKSWFMKINDIAIDVWNYKWQNGFIGDSSVEYFRSLNQIRIPAGILQLPFFSSDFPGFMNFGGIGSVIAREMARVIEPNAVYVSGDEDFQFLPDEKSYKSYIDWSARLQTEWQNDFNANDKIINVIAYHITVNGYNEWLKDLKKDGNDELELPGLAEQSPQKLLLVKHTNVLCESLSITRSRKDRDHHSTSSKYSLIPVTQTNHFLQLFQCEAERFSSSFDLS